MSEHHHEHGDGGGDEQEGYRPKSFEAVIEVLSEVESAEAVHAWLNNGSEWYIHAWAEAEGVVLDLTEARKPQNKDEYYQRRNVDERYCKRYTRLEFFTLMAENGGFGPYDTEFFFATTSEKDPLEG